MSKIDDLIAEYCPNGVEFKTLGEIGDIKMCRRIFKHETQAEGDIPFYKIGTFGKVPNAFISLELFEEYKSKFSYPNVGDVLISASGTIGRTVIYKGEDAYFQDSNIVWLANDEKSVLNKFLFYYYKIIKWQIDSGGTISRLYNDNIKKAEIPVPPLPVQEEIVKILDSFTTLEAELEAELEARTRQYEFYRNQLLSFEGNLVEWKALGEVGEFIRGSGLQKKDFTESGIGCIHYGQIYTHYGTYATTTKSFVSEDLASKLRKAKKGDLIIAGVSENIEDVCKAVVWLGDEEICISGDSFAYRHKQNPKFLGYLFQTNSFLEFKKKFAQGAKVTRLRSGSLPNFLIPVPPLKEQERIVGILDKFDSLVNSISEGLPAEIQARRQQYEYYRGQLLNFTSVS